MQNNLKSEKCFIIDESLITEGKATCLLDCFESKKIVPLIIDSWKNNKDLPGIIIIFAIHKNVKKFSKIKNKLIILDLKDLITNKIFFKIDFSSTEEIYLFLQKLEMSDKKNELLKRVRSSHHFYEELKVLNKIKQINEQEFILHNKAIGLDRLLDLEMFLLKDDNIKNWHTHFNKFIQEQEGPEGIETIGIFCQEDLLLENKSFYESHLIFKIPYENYFLVLCIKLEKKLEQIGFLELVITMILRSIQVLDQHLIKSDGEVDFWKKIFSKIPYPMAVISSLGDLLIYNEHFFKVGILPKECLLFVDQEKRELFNCFYKIRRIDFFVGQLSISSFVFYTAEYLKNGKTVNKEVDRNLNKSVFTEMGIVASSMAHELNNPIAGILAALSLLSLEENLPKDQLADLEEMRIGAVRCKELVSIFLGFSRVVPVISGPLTVSDAFFQAMNLVKFRMVEAGLRLDIKYIPILESFYNRINVPVLSMVFYLIFNEVITRFSHDRLILNPKFENLSNVINGEVSEFKDHIVLKIGDDFNFLEKLAQIKIVHYFLSFENLKINFYSNELRIVINNPEENCNYLGFLK